METSKTIHFFTTFYFRCTIGKLYLTLNIQRNEDLKEVKILRSALELVHGAVEAKTADRYMKPLEGRMVLRVTRKAHHHGSNKTSLLVLMARTNSGSKIGMILDWTPVNMPV